jgi:anti-sigma B factor antagonist
MNLEVKHMEQEGTDVLQLRGEVDAYTITELKEVMKEIMTKENQEVVVDLEEVTYMDSTGLGVFISALKSAKEHNSELKLINIQDRVYRLFKITGLDEIMDINAAIKGGNE